MLIFQLANNIVTELLISIGNISIVDLKHVLCLAESALVDSTDVDYNSDADQSIACRLLDGTNRCGGILNIIKSAHVSDCRRAYSCIKFLAQASTNSKSLKVRI